MTDIQGPHEGSTKVEPDYLRAKEMVAALVEQIVADSLGAIDCEAAVQHIVVECRMKKGVIEQELKEILRREQVPLSGKSVSGKVASPWLDPEPIESPYPLSKVLDMFEKIIHRQVMVTEHAAVAVALYVAGTWGYEECDIFPRLVITSPMKRCGKSTLLATTQIGVRSPLKADNVSAAAFFRVIAEAPVTLLIDEVDRFVAGDGDLISALNAGYESSGVVLRAVPTESGDHVVRRFPVYAPALLAGIGGLPDTVLDRSIIIEMQRAGGNASVRKRPVRQARRVALRAGLAPQMAAHRQAIGAAMAKGVASSTIPHELDDREADNWDPLLAVADAAGGAWPAKARVAARTLTARRGIDKKSLREQLLADLRAYFYDLCLQRITEWRDARTKGTAISMRPRVLRVALSAHVLEYLVSMPSAPWHDLRDRQLTGRALADFLRPLNIKPYQGRPDPATIAPGPSAMSIPGQRSAAFPLGAKLNFYHIREMRRAWKRYL